MTLRDPAHTAISVVLMSAGPQAGPVTLRRQQASHGGGGGGETGGQGEGDRGLGRGESRKGSRVRRGKLHSAFKSLDIF